MLEKYDTIGAGYNTTRRADEYLVSRLYQYLSPILSGKYLDVGCGTGNYTSALREKGVPLTGLDPSSEMLKKAISNNPEIKWVQGRSEKIPFGDGEMEGALATLTIHHWGDLTLGFREINRVLKKGRKFILFTSTSEQMKGYWLNYYFPKMMKKSMAQMPAMEKINTALVNAGFEIVESEPYFIRPDLQDLFLYAGKSNPSLYLDEKVRNGISSFSNLANMDEVMEGLGKLEKDINSGKIIEIIASYAGEAGDYLFISALKK